MVGDWMVGGVQMEFTVVLLAFCGRGESGVGFGDEDEALGGAWVGRVTIWVVGFGEGVEGPNRWEISFGLWTIRGL
jgi:hypothetical protein